jgi:putative uncharacterized protein cgl1852
MSSDTKRMTVRLDSAEYETVRFWSSKIGISENDFVREAIALKIRHVNGDYDLPTAEIQRLNQLIDLIGSLSSNISNLEDVTVSGFQSLISLTRGDNYLLDNDD